MNIASLFPVGLAGTPTAAGVVTWNHRGFSVDACVR